MIEERRARNLLARNAASQEDYDKAEAQRKKSAAQVESDRASLAEAEADYRIDIENAKAEVARAESAVENAEINLGYCRMYRSDRWADRRAEGQARQPGGRHRRHRARQPPAA